MITAGLLSECAPRCDAAGLAPSLETAAQARMINTPLRVAHFLAQLHVETGGFTAFEENLSYSAARLIAVWPSRFPNLVAATPYAHNPQALADKVYGARMGNTQPGDGWRYRGRGAGLTGRDNYRLIGAMIGEDLEDDPDLAATPRVFAEAAACFWTKENLSPLADADDLAGITEKWNGGLTDLAARRDAVKSYKHALGMVIA